MWIKCEIKFLIGNFCFDSFYSWTYRKTPYLPKFVKMGFCDTKTNIENLKKKQFLPLIAVPNKFKLGNYIGPKIEFLALKILELNFGTSYYLQEKLIKQGLHGTIFDKIISNTVRIWYVPTGRSRIIRRLVSRLFFHKRGSNLNNKQNLILKGYQTRLIRNNFGNLYDHTTPIGENSL